MTTSHQYEASYVTQSLIRFGLHDGKTLGPRCESIGVKCLSLGHNDHLPTSGTESRVDNLAIAKLRSYLLSCTAAKVRILTLSVFPKTQQREMPRVGIKLAAIRLLFCAQQTELRLRHFSLSDWLKMILLCKLTEDVNISITIKREKKTENSNFAESFDRIYSINFQLKLKYCLLKPKYLKID